jgi:Zn-finger nucleic acid-binding protein
MVQETYAGNYGSQVAIDVCHHCNGIWFDGRESLQLAAGSTIRLFKSIHDRQAKQRSELHDAMSCPRCAGTLQKTHDQVRTTKFSYYRCAQHGRFITFFEWLREKSLVRPPNAKELSDLKARVTVVNCSNCGAPVSIDTETACNHCAAPVSVLASENIEKTLKDLQAQEVDRNTFKPEKLAEAMFIKQKIESQYRAQEMADSFRSVGRYGGAGFAGDLVGLGVGLLLGALFD